ncbi:MAG TPA: DUF983 domain-containing protein [Gemmatimonadaceae bacterium]|nr:DUF983 domain-containing protein [Gemmatimonadaceae bacterium]
MAATLPPASSVATKFGRAIVLRCPRCGGSGILRGWLHLQERCPRCGLALERGERSDFWIGAYVFNLVAGEVLGLGIPIVWMIMSSPNQPWTAIEILAVVLCVALPFIFFPFSRTLWLAWDLSFRPIEPGDAKGGAAGDVNAPPHPND